jgi:hypothetical protein
VTKFQRLARVAAVTLCIHATHAVAELAREITPINIGGARLDITLEPAVFELPDDALATWVQRSAEAVVTYYGRFPVPTVDIRLRASAGSKVRTGRMFGGAVPKLQISVGEASTRPALQRDWVLVHEMVHTAFPDVPYHQNWIEEGLAVYVESIARMQAGHLSPKFVWGGFVRGMPNGLPQPGDEGLDRTDSWGNRYWGGALFCLLADLEIRRRSDNRLGLQHALRAILEADLDHRRTGSITQAFRIGDEATGTGVLMELYEAGRDTAVATDLDKLWRQLGVRIKDGKVILDEHASEAHLRIAISDLQPGHNE